MAGRRIIVGVTGGIAAYKSAELVRLLKKADHDVQVVMTEGAHAFITPLTFQALTGREVRDTLLDPAAEAGMGHIELARWAELVLVAPASADAIARLNAGMANDLLTTVCLATTAPVVIAPAMNQAMWLHPLTQRNVASLQSIGVRVWGPADGEQACGDVGPGRMLEPVDLAGRVAACWTPCTGSLGGKHVVITAGPTQEAIDPVRYISNHSSGKMGYALAEAACDAGARVTLVTGPVALAVPAGVRVERVTSAGEMLAASTRLCDEGCDIFIAAAAVADYRPATVAASKIKKQGEDMSLALTRNPDIVATIAARPDRPFVVGFAAETNDVLSYARGKLSAKKLDMIVANDVSVPGIGFGAEQNAVTVVTADGECSIGPKPKTAVAADLINVISDRIRAESP